MDAMSIGLVAAGLVGGIGAQRLANRKMKRESAQKVESLEANLVALRGSAAMPLTDIRPHLETAWSLRSSEDQVLWSAFGSYLVDALQNVQG